MPARNRGWRPARWMPRLRSCHLSRGYSTSQPVPKARSLDLRRGVQVNWRPPPASACCPDRSRHSCLGPVQQRGGSRGGEVPQAADDDGRCLRARARPRGTAARTGSPAAAAGQAAHVDPALKPGPGSAASGGELPGCGRPRRSSSCACVRQNGDGSASPTVRSQALGRCADPADGDGSSAQPARQCPGVPARVHALAVPGTGPCRAGT